MEINGNGLNEAKRMKYVQLSYIVLIKSLMDSILCRQKTCSTIDFIDYMIRPSARSMHGNNYSYIAMARCDDRDLLLQ